MNNTSVSAAVRSRLAEVHESLADVHMGVPVGDILDRARRRHARRRHGALAAAAGTGGSVALAAALILLPGSAARTSTHPAQLTAWTVTRQPNGEIKVTIRELKDPAGLQRKLRADGVPASVSFLRDQDLACRLYLPVYQPYDAARLRRVFPLGGNIAVLIRHKLPPQHVVLLIRPSALPRGAGVRIATSSLSGLHSPKPGIAPRLGPRPGMLIGVELVYASRGCTGS